MNFPVNKPEDYHQVDLLMKDYKHEMYMQIVRERDSLEVSKAEVDKLYSQTRAELIDTENPAQDLSETFRCNW